jgi:hypothetical protein
MVRHDLAMFASRLRLMHHREEGLSNSVCRLVIESHPLLIDTVLIVEAGLTLLTIYAIELLVNVDDSGIWRMRPLTKVLVRSRPRPRLCEMNVLLNVLSGTLKPILHILESYVVILGTHWHKLLLLASLWTLRLLCHNLSFTSRK